MTSVIDRVKQRISALNTRSNAFKITATIIALAACASAAYLLLYQSKLLSPQNDDDDDDKEKKGKRLGFEETDEAEMTRFIHQTVSRPNLCHKKRDAANLIVFIATWNVNGKKPSDDLMWLLIHPKYHCDVIVIGVQEFVDLNAKNIVNKNKMAKREVLWSNKIKHLLSRFRFRGGGGDDDEEYSLIAVHKLVGICSFVFVRESIREDFTELCTTEVKLGLLFNSVGNKGAVGVRWRYKNRLDMCFVNCHLAAHQHKEKKRNKDSEQVFSKMSFVFGKKKRRKKSREVGDDEEGKQHDRLQSSMSSLMDSLEINGSMDEETWSELDASERRRRRVVRVLNHDMIFCFGDLNYRLNFDVEEEEGVVKELVRKGEYGELMRRDQLKENMQSDGVFYRFEEGQIKFAPTFKFLAGTNTYCGERTRSYCDRVLWKANNKRVECLEYTSCHRLTMSDHKPVYAVFECQTV